MQINSASAKAAAFQQNLGTTGPKQFQIALHKLKTKPAVHPRLLVSEFHVRQSSSLAIHSIKNTVGNGHSAFTVAHVSRKYGYYLCPWRKFHSSASETFVYERCTVSLLLSFGIFSLIPFLELKTKRGVGQNVCCNPNLRLGAQGSLKLSIQICRTCVGHIWEDIWRVGRCNSG